MMLLVVGGLGTRGSAQVTNLSTVDPATAWRKAQIEINSEQLSRNDLDVELAKELAVQKKWLEAWNPGKLSQEPVWDGGKKRSLVSEPIIDPSGLAKSLRSKLFGPSAMPSTRDTDQLKQLLIKHPKDIGIRQLHLNWLDQYAYRKQYAMEIVQAAETLIALIEGAGLKKTQDLIWANKYANYRRVRALVYRGLPDVVASNPLEDPVAYEGALSAAYLDFKRSEPNVRPEFVLVELRMLRRDGLFGRALGLLEEYGTQIEKKWLLKKRRDLLQELGWKYPAAEAAKMYEDLFPEELAKEPGLAE